MHHYRRSERGWKTTFSRKVLADQQGILHFVNVDLIAAGLSPLHPQFAARAAGRLLLSELDRLTSARTSLALGSTLSGMTYLERMRRMKELGYSVEIIFLGPRSPGLAIKRVAHRVKQGGHQVSAEDVRRRFERGWSDL
jgi:predicted ABC-type ATPase